MSHSSPYEGTLPALRFTQAENREGGLVGLMKCKCSQEGRSWGGNGQSAQFRGRGRTQNVTVTQKLQNQKGSAQLKSESDSRNTCLQGVKKSCQL